MSTKNILNTTATFGQVVVGVQALSSIFLAVLLLITGGQLMGERHMEVPAVVTGVDCVNGSGCAVTAVYKVGAETFQGTFSTYKEFSYAPMDQITLLVNPSDPTQVLENMPWSNMGFAMMLVGLALVFAGYYAVRVVSERKNVATIAGVFGFLRLLI